MSERNKFFLNLSKNLKGFIVFQFAKLKTNNKIKKQANWDKKIIAQVNRNKLPNWKQFKQIPQTLSPNEKRVIRLLMAAVAISLVFLFYTNYLQKLVSIPKDGGDLTEALIGSPLYINPLFAQSHTDVDLDLTKLIFSGLMKYNSNLEIVPDLAEKYEISEDQKTYTFYIKQNVKWHDNQDLTASDIVFTILSIKNPEFKSPLNRSFEGVNVEKIDDYTVKFTLTEPYAAFLNILTVGIIPQHLWYDTPAINAKLAIYNQKPIGSGPYKFKSLLKEKNGVIKTYTLEKNKNYHGKIPYINKMIFKFYPDYENAIDALINKNVLNLSFLPKEYLKKLANKRDWNLTNFNLSQYTAIFFNQKNNELLKNKNVRQALSMALDRNKILEDVLQNQGQVIESPILPGFLGYSPEIKSLDYNQQKAVELLTADGWILDNDIFKKGDQELKITLTTVEQNENINTANIIKDYWTSIGVNVELQIIAKDKIENEVINPRNYQALLYGEILGYDPDPFPFWHSSQAEAPGVNLANYVNRKVDQLLEEARLTNDPTIRQTKYQEFQKLLLEDIPAIFLYSPTYTYALSKKVKGVEVQRITKPFDRFINVENWYIKTKKQFLQ